MAARDRREIDLYPTPVESGEGGDQRASRLGRAAGHDRVRLDQLPGRSGESDQGRLYPAAERRDRPLRAEFESLPKRASRHRQADPDGGRQLLRVPVRAGRRPAANLSGLDPAKGLVGRAGTRRAGDDRRLACRAAGVQGAQRHRGAADVPRRAEPAVRHRGRRLHRRLRHPERLLPGERTGQIRPAGARDTGRFLELVERWYAEGLLDRI